MTESYHVFLSHNSVDKPAVEELACRLHQEGIEGWLDKWHLVPGEPWQPAIEKALEACASCCVFIGPSGMGPWQNEEMRAAIDRRVSTSEDNFRVIPVVLPGGQRGHRSRLPTFLASTTWVEFRQSLDDEDAFHRLKCGIRGFEPGAGPGQAIYEGQCPYRGLQTFQPEHAAFFFGREARIEWLLDELRNGFNTKEENRFLGIVGASGSGKSSLARAGLVPALRNGLLPDSDKWPIIICRPGPDPLEELAKSLYSESALRSAAHDVGDLIDRLSSETRRLHLTTSSALFESPDTHRVVLLVDQFEELFTLCLDDTRRISFIDNLLYASSQTGGRTVVVLTMRADFYGKCSAYPNLADALSDHQELVPPMTKEELRRAIERPAQFTGCELEPGLTEMLLEAVENQHGALPLLQHALRQLWLRRSGRKLTVQTYREIGRLEGALDRHANELFDRLPDDQQDICRRIFLRLIQPGEGSEDTKRRASRSELGRAESIDRVLSQLADARLITTSSDEPSGKNPFVDISHEALIRGWHRLGQWISDNRESIRIRQRLSVAASEWLEHDRDEAYLFRGARLVEAEEWSQEHSSELAEEEEQFLSAGVEARDWRRRNEIRRTKLITASALVASVLAIVATIMYFQARDARQRAEEAEHNADNARIAAEDAKENAEDERDKARLQLAKSHWQNGVIQRDVYDNPSKASHYFTAAALEFRGATIESRNARLAAEVLSCSNELKCVFEHQGPVIGAVFSTDERSTLTWSKAKTPEEEAGAAWLWDTHRGSLIRKLQHDGPVLGAAFTSDERRILTWSEDGTARLWNVERGEELVRFEHDDVVQESHFNSDESRILTRCDDFTARLWDVGNENVLAEFEHDASVNGAEFSPDEEHILTWSDDGTVRLWDATSGAEVKQIRHDSTPRFPFWGSLNVNAIRSYGTRVTLAQYVSETVILTGGTDGVRFWDVVSGEEFASYGHSGAVLGAQFSPDGSQRYLLTWSSDGTAKLWDTPLERVVRVFRHGGTVLGAEFSMGWSSILTWGTDGNVQEWTYNDEIAEAVNQYKHDDAVLGVSLTSRNRYLLTWSADHTARIWDTESGEAISQFNHSDRVSGALLSTKNPHVLTWSTDGTARLWDLTGLKRLQNASSRDPFVNADDDRSLTDFEKELVVLPNAEMDYDLLRQWLVLRLQVRTGTQMDEFGELRTLSRDKWIENKRLYEEVIPGPSLPR